MLLGPYRLPNPVFVAPMAGVTDRPYRRLCRRLGAGYAVSEMAASNPKLWATVKTSRRIDHAGEPGPVAVQLAGADPQMMAEAARFNVDRGAQVIDINMGCPAKKVCNVAAGSALMADQSLALRIVQAVVAAVNVPVTVKMRTGIDRAQRNAVSLALGMQDAGAALITVHGRSRACAFQGEAEYDTIAQVKQALRIPVVANGDIDSPAKAAWVMARTGADAVMIGRAGQGNPWLYRQVAHFLAHGELLPAPSLSEIRQVLREHLEDHYAFHGPVMGPRIARKHIGWYVGQWGDRAGADAKALLAAVNQAEDPEQQLRLLDEFLCASEDEIAVH
ncbi:MAG: tRNA dihydrouridine synthase DusB [Burkholderiales bacterium]|jgi:tRNA-dihydrouridine synthase B